MLRRAEGRPQRGVIRIAGMSLDPVTRTVVLDGSPVDLSVVEFSLLQRLAKDPERVFTKNELLRDVWGYLSVGRTRTVDAHACRLRRKMENDSPRKWIVNVRGVGYRLTDPV